MIENFQISNFKGFNEPLKIDISPITLIFGPNSSGKSSIIDSLQMLKYSGPNSIQTYVEGFLDLGKNEEILSRQNKNTNKYISYSFTFKYSNLDKPKGATLSSAKEVQIKKEFKLNKDKLFELNAVSFYIENNFLFSLDIKVAESTNNYSAKLNKFSNDYDFLKKIFNLDYFEDDNFFLKNSRKIDFIINQRLKDEKLQDSKIISDKNKIQTFELATDNIKDFKNLYLDFKKTNNTNKIVNFFKSKKDFYNFEFYLIENLLKNKSLKTSIIKKIFDNEYAEEIDDVYDKPFDRLTFVVSYLNKKLQEVFNIDDENYIFIKWKDKSNNYLEWVDLDLDNTVLKILTKEMKNISKNINIMTLNNNDEFKNFTTEELKHFLTIFDDMSNLFSKISINKFKTDWKIFEKKFFDDIISNLKNNYKLNIELGFVYGTSKPKAIFERKKNTLIDYLNITKENFFSNIEDIIDHCDALIDETLNNFTFIPCYRNYERVYRATQKSFRSLNEISKSTSDLVDALSEDPELLKEVNEWLITSAFNSEIFIEKNRDTKMMYIIEKETGVTINIADAGSGIRNLIPIITVSILSNKNQNNLKNTSSKMTPDPIIALEEPEVNLHPKLQIDLAEFLIKFSKNKKFIIETHSELMMRKCQQLIRNGEISKDEVKVYCVRKNKEGHYVDEIRLDKFGNFRDEWPHGFFKERMDLLD